jgi:hypothetical protein
VFFAACIPFIGLALAEIHEPKPSAREKIPATQIFNLDNLVSPLKPAGNATISHLKMAIKLLANFTF